MGKNKKTLLPVIIAGKVEMKSPVEALSSVTFGTSLQGMIETSYAKLVKTFGKPDVKNIDTYKSDAEWTVFTPAGIATIYNYKDGKNYLGKEGLSVEKIKDWHIGGRKETVVDYIRMVLKCPMESKNGSYPARMLLGGI